LCSKGVNLNHEVLLRRFADLGCRIDLGRCWVWFTEEIIDRSLASAPRQVRLWNLEGTEFWDLSGDNVHFTPGSAAIKMVEHNSGGMRPATVEDMLRYVRLVGQLEYISYPATAVVPHDVSPGIEDSVRLYALLLADRRPIVTGAFTIRGFDVMRDLQLAVRGTCEALRERPFTLFSCCPTSPFKWSDITSDNTMKAAELGIPVEFISMPLPGLVAPITLVGSLIQHTVETLSGIVISQTSRPGAPVVYGGSPGCFDMRTMAATISSVEAQMMDCAYAQIGKRLGLPTQAYIGMSDSKALDAQAGFESGTGVYLAALAGINSLSGPGMLYFESSFSLEKLVFDNQVCGMARRLIEGVQPRDDFPADAVIDELLETKNLLGSEHTLKYFRLEHFVPGVPIDRKLLGELPDDYPLLGARAHAQVERLVGQYRPPGILQESQIADLERIIAAVGGAEIAKRIRADLL
jgi:trimethylamine--corrinoid protein Co-methyltransferase